MIMVIQTTFLNLFVDNFLQSNKFVAVTIITITIIIMHWVEFNVFLMQLYATNIHLDYAATVSLGFFSLFPWYIILYIVLYDVKNIILLVLYYFIRHRETDKR